MIKRFVVLAAVGMTLITVSDAAAQPSTPAKPGAADSKMTKPRFYNPFLPRYRRLAVSPFGFPQFTAGGFSTTELATRPIVSSAPGLPVATTPVAAAVTASPIVTAPAPTIVTAPPIVTAPVALPVVPSFAPALSTITSLAAAASPTTADANAAASSDYIVQPVSGRPDYRPPVRSPYRPPPRPPF